MKQFKSNDSANYTTFQTNSLKFTEDDVQAIRSDERKRVVDVLCDESWFFDDDCEEQLRERVDLDYEEKLEEHRKQMYEELEKEYEQKFITESQKIKENLQSQKNTKNMEMQDNLWEEFQEFCNNDLQNSQEFQNSVQPMGMAYFMAKKCN